MISVLKRRKEIKKLIGNEISVFYEWLYVGNKKPSMTSVKRVSGEIVLIDVIFGNDLEVEKLIFQHKESKEVLKLVGPRVSGLLYRFKHKQS